jgi:hypothetical protein
MTVVDTFVEWAHAGLNQSEEAKNYLLGRGVSQEQCAKHRLGYVLACYHPDSTVDSGHSAICSDRSAIQRWCDSCRFIRWSSLWEEEEGGPKVQHVGKRIVGCVVMPLTSYAGTTVGFQVRSITEKRFDSFALTRRPEGYFFGVASNMDAIWAEKKAFTVEGPFDQLVFERLLGRNVVGLTTNTPNASQTRFFRRFTDWIGLFLDMDKAGRDGVEIFRERMGDGPCVEDFRIEGVKKRTGEKCKDLNEAWAAMGDRRFAQHFASILRGTHERQDSQAQAPRGDF